jgi:hypothetical protein
LRGEPPTTDYFFLREIGPETTIRVFPLGCCYVNPKHPEEPTSDYTEKTDLRNAYQ